jgi:hypothetical protein
MLDYCLELSIIEALKMLDLQTKSAINLNFNQICGGQSDKFRFRVICNSYGLKLLLGKALCMVTLFSSVTTRR